MMRLLTLPPVTEIDKVPTHEVPTEIARLLVLQAALQFASPVPWLSLRLRRPISPPVTSTRKSWRSTYTFVWTGCTSLLGRGGFPASA